MRQHHEAMTLADRIVIMRDGHVEQEASCTVAIAEPLGTETMLFTALGGAEVQGKMLNPRPVAPGEQLPFTLDLSRLHVFDKVSGMALR